MSRDVGVIELPGCAGHRVAFYHERGKVVRIRAGCNLKVADAVARLGGEASGCLEIYRAFRNYMTRDDWSWSDEPLAVFANAALAARRLRAAARGEEPLQPKRYLERYKAAVAKLVQSMIPVSRSISVEIDTQDGWDHLKLGWYEVALRPRGRSGKWSKGRPREVKEFAQRMKYQQGGSQCGWCGGKVGYRGGCLARTKHVRAVEEWLDQLLAVLNHWSRAELIRRMEALSAE
jgi:hypothetical protein